LAPSSTGNGNLQLNDGEGTRRLNLNGGGSIEAFEQDGTTPAFRAGRTFEVGGLGVPLLNGVQLGPDGSISMIPPES